MPYDTVKSITTILVLFFIFVFFHSKFKKQSITESIKNLRDGFKEIFGLE